MGLQYTLHLERSPVFSQEVLKMYPCPQITVNYEVGNKIKFSELRTKYSVDDDVMVGYSVLEGVNTSTRDWIGIFPRGWTNLEQYITFEYAISPTTKQSAVNRSVMFVKTLFSKQVSLLTDYQFVYVSRRAHILGMSPYFRFTSLSSPDGIANDTSSAIEEHETQQGVTETDGYPPTIVKLDNGSAVESPIVATSEAIKVAQSQETGRSCDISNIDQFLRSHVDMLAARVMRMERDLELARARAKQEKLARACLVQRLEAYQAFVKDMFGKLTNDSVIKIMDSAGTEVIIRRVNAEELSSYRNKLSSEFAGDELALPKKCASINDETNEFEDIMTSEIQPDLVDGDTQKSEQIVENDATGDADANMKMSSSNPGMVTQGVGSFTVL